MSTPPVYIFEDSQVQRLYPLTYGRAAGELRVGALTLVERLARNLHLTPAGLFARDAVADVLRRRTSLPVNPGVSAKEGLLLLNARWLLLKGAHVWKEVPHPDSAGITQSTVVWMHLSPELASKIDVSKLHDPRTLEAALQHVNRQTCACTLINRPWDLLDHQAKAIIEDFETLGAANHSTALGAVHLLNPQNIHLGEGVKLWPGAVLDATKGPIIVGAETEIRANAVITGPTCIGERCVIRTAADIRENCSIGNGGRVGGEVVGSIFMNNANKQHYGFVGQSIIGEFTNLGAGATTSNLKNTYGLVKMAPSGTDETTGRQFLGSIVGDHAKVGIGTYLSTGSVVGFASHVVVPRPPRFVPSFAWVDSEDAPIQRANFEKIEQIAATVMSRRGVEFTPADHELFVQIAAISAVTETFPWPDV